MLTTLSLFLLPVILPQDSLAGQLPKRDLGVEAYLSAYPEYDGRGIRVAVLDTGIDPGHPFLQATPSGTRKIVDWYDATTDGRLDTSWRTPAEDGFVYGLSGRKLTLGQWFKKDREYHLGRIDSSFLPGGLSGRISGDRRQEWEEAKRDWEEAGARWNALHPGDDTEVSVREEEIERRWTSGDVHGPVWDLVTFHDGEQWMVVIDNDQDGDLDEEPALRSFRESGDWHTLGDEANLNYAVSVPDDGDLTMLYFDSNGHGTHVAGIIGAYQGLDGRMNGVAPGVEFVAIKIGDGKYGGATSGFAIAKALDYAVEAGCTVANMSFGGPSFFADGNEPDAWVIEEARRRGLVVVTSAGNEGPTLSTIGAPATVDAAFSIAAAVWPDTQKVNYGSLAPSEPVLFDFSSRGPLPNGGYGVDFTAPGAALSTLPSWTNSKGENYNGTSMAAPQASACVALLQCAAAAEGLLANPARVHRAMRLGAKPLIQHAWVEQGFGVIAMLPSLAQLRSLNEIGASEIDYQVSVNNPFGNGAGIYLRDLADPSKVHDSTVSISPVFADDATNRERSDFLHTFRIEAESGWVTAPEAFYTSSNGARFTVRIDASQLAPGLHSTRLLLWDVDQPQAAGPEIVVPVTVVIPHQVTTGSARDFESYFACAPGQLERTFIRVPAGANYAKVKFTQLSSGRNEYRTGAGAVSGFRYEGDRQKRGRFFIDLDQSAEQTVPVEAGTVFEYTIASRWAVNQPAKLKLEVEFIGLVGQASEMVIPAGQEVGYFAIKSMLQATRASASAKIEGVAIPVMAAMTIVPDPIRATIMGGRGMFYGLVEWEQNIPDDTTVSLFTPYSIQTTEIREDLMLEVFDSMGRLHSRQIVWEWDTEIGSMDAGDYTFRLSYPSLGKEALESRFAAAEVRLHNQDSSLDMYTNLEKAMLAQGGGGNLRIPFMGARSIFARVPELEALESGAYYFGTLSLSDGDDTLLSVPLRVERPVGADNGTTVVEASSSVGRVSTEVSDSESAFFDAPNADAKTRLKNVRAWKEAESDDPEAALFELTVLAAAGLQDFAWEMAAGFLGDFPWYTAEFLAAAPAWNN